MNGLGRVLDIKTTYSKQYLSDKLKEHLENHILDYRKANEVYQKDLREALDNLTKASQDGNLQDVKDKFNKVFAITKPVNASKAYNQYIDLFWASSDDFIELTMQDANAIINDEWDWAINAKMTNSFYSSRS